MLRMSMVFVLLFATACEKNSARPGEGQAPRGLPPSAESQKPAADPHAGMDMNDPHAGMDMENPHAAGAMANPHGGGAMGNQPPAPVDPNMFIEGTIVPSKEMADKIKEGDILFLTAKTIGEDGEIVRFPIAVDRLDVTRFPMKFRLTGKNSMMPGTKFEGTVMVQARIDRDGEARTRQHGDIEGQVKVTIPQKDVKLVLDTPVK